MKLGVHLFACLTIAAFAVNRAEAFRSVYNAPSNHSDEGISIVGDGAGGCYMVGSAYSAQTGTYDTHVVAVGHNGSIRWTFEDRRAAESEEPVRILRDPATGRLTVLSSVSGSSGRWLRVSSFLPSGSRQFERDLRSDFTSMRPDVALDSAGAALVAGTRAGECFVAKVSSGGSVEWEVPIDVGVGQAESNSIDVDDDGTIALLAIPSSFFGGYVTAKLSPVGGLLWTHTYFGNHGAVLGPGWVRFGSTGDVFVCGSPETSFGVPQHVVYRLAGASGSPLWSKTYRADPTFDSQATGFEMDRFDNAVVSSFRLTQGTAGLVVKYGPQGQSLWERTVTGGSVNLSDVAIDGAGNIAACGYESTGQAVGFVVCFSAAGDFLSKANQSRDIYNQIVSDGKRGFFAVGSFFDPITNQDFVAVSVPSPVFRAPRIP